MHQLRSLELPGLAQELQLMLRQGGATTTVTNGSTSGGSGASGNGGSGSLASAGRTTYRLPSREALALVLYRLLAGACGMARPYSPVPPCPMRGCGSEAGVRSGWLLAVMPDGTPRPSALPPPLPSAPPPVR